MQATSVEKRRQVRKELDAAKLFVVDVIQDKSGLTRDRQYGIVLNVSEGGMAVQPFRPLAAETDVEISWSHPGKSSVSLGRGSVAWQGCGGRTGLKFVNSPPTHRAQLQDFLLSASTGPSSAEPLSACTVNSETTEWESALQLIAYSAMVVTDADGAAVALNYGSAIECRASVGSAPPTGTEVRQDTGLSAHCLRTGGTLLCNDTWTDPRLESAQQSETRAVAIVPISLTPANGGNKMVGLMEVFSHRPDHFLPQDMDRLNSLAGIIAEAQEENDSVGGTALNANLGETKVEEKEAAAVFTDYSKTELPVLLEVADQGRGSKQLLIFGAVGAAIALILLTVFLTRVAMISSMNAPKNAPQSAIPPQNVLSEKTQAVGAPSTISFYPATIRQRVGKSFAVSVIAKGAKNVSSLPLQIQYDPEKLQVLKVLNGDLLGHDGQPATLAHREDNVTGSIHITASRPPSAPGVSGDGVLLTLTFLAKAPGQTRLRISQTGASDASSPEAAPSASEAIINVSPAPTDAASEPEPKIETPVTYKSAAASASESKASLLVENVIPGSLIIFDGRSGAVSALDGKVGIGNLSPGEHHLSLSNHGNKYFDQTISLKPGLTVHIDARVPSSSLTPLPTSSTTVPGAAPGIPDAGSKAMLAIPAKQVLRPPNYVLDHTLQGHSNWVTAVAFSADGQRIVSGSWDRSVKLWESSSGKRLNDINGIASIQALAYSNDGRWLAAEDDSNNIRIWNAATGTQTRSLPGSKTLLDKSWVYSIAFSPDGRWIAAAADNKTIRMWDVESGKVVRDFVSSARPILYTAFSPNGRWIATGGDSNSIVVLDVATGDVYRTLKGHKEEVCVVAFSPNGRWLASAGKDKTIKIWELKTGRELNTLTGHKDRVTSLAFSTNSRWLATGSWDKTAKIWNVETGREVQTLTGHTHRIYSLAFESRGAWIATGSEDGTIKLWRLQPEIDAAASAQPAAVHTN